jgi:hypothetical protein
MRLGLSFDGASYIKEMAEAKAKRGKFVFPGRDPGGPLSDMAMFMLLRDMCPSEKVTVHGFRSSFRDWAGEETNYPHDICEVALAHAIGGGHGKSSGQRQRPAPLGPGSSRAQRQIGASIHFS